MSASSSLKLRIFAWTVLGSVLLGIAALFVRSELQRSHLPRLAQVQPFVLTNQFGQVVTARDLLGKVWVGDIIFTRCGGPCPRMTEQMSKLQKTLPAGQPLNLVTLTTDPDNDTPSVLKSYGEKFGADSTRWIFLTGTKSELKNLAAGSLKLAAVEKDPSERRNPNDLFIHSTIFVLVDKSGNMRGVYESLEPGFQEKIVADIQALLQEN